MGLSSGNTSLDSDETSIPATGQTTWFTFFSHREQRPYYYDPVSGTSSWLRPPDGAINRLPGSPPQSCASLPRGSTVTAFNLDSDKNVGRGRTTYERRILPIITRPSVALTMLILNIVLLCILFGHYFGFILRVDFSAMSPSPNIVATMNKPSSPAPMPQVAENKRTESTTPEINGDERTSRMSLRVAVDDLHLDSGDNLLQESLGGGPDVENLEVKDESMRSIDEHGYTAQHDGGGNGKERSSMVVSTKPDPALNDVNEYEQSQSLGSVAEAVQQSLHDDVEQWFSADPVSEIKQESSRRNEIILGTTEESRGTNEHIVHTEECFDNRPLVGTSNEEGNNNFSEMREDLAADTPPPSVSRIVSESPVVDDESAGEIIDIAQSEEQSQAIPPTTTSSGDAMLLAKESTWEVDDKTLLEEQYEDIPMVMNESAENLVSNVNVDKRRRENSDPPLVDTLAAKDAQRESFPILERELAQAIKDAMDTSSRLLERVIQQASFTGCAIEIRTPEIAKHQLLQPLRLFEGVSRPKTRLNCISPWNCHRQSINGGDSL